MTAKVITTAQVVLEARRLRALAEKIRNPDTTNTAHDPWADPYAPSDATAYQLCSTRGPQEALAELRRRAQAKDTEALAARQADERREKRERKRREQDRHERELRLVEDPGLFIRNALAAFSVVAEGYTASPDGRVSRDSAHPSRIPRPRWDDFTRARATAILAARTIADELDQASRRVLRTTTVMDRDERLRRRWRGYTPEQVAIGDREQGSPRMVRNRRRELRLDELTGDPLDERDAA